MEERVKKRRILINAPEDMPQDYNFFCDIYHQKMTERVNEVVMCRRVMNAPYHAAREGIKREFCVSYTVHANMAVKAKTDDERCQKLLLRTNPAIGRLISEHNFSYE
tara:strand:+ start:187 stop:507 length:321 start_codon:yes stop_codon:yes gene_type:complete